jgi:phthiocerol/phenolphthiocerol synthesis type-I polyketide synthase E
MPDLPERISSLPPDKRLLLQRLLRGGIAAPGADNNRERGYPGYDEAQSPSGQSRMTAPALVSDENDSSEEAKSECRAYYNTINQQLNATEFGKFSFFLNYGYVPNGNQQDAQVALPEHYLNMNSARLVLELIGVCKLAGCSLLDVGCGRGGTLEVILEFFPVKRAAGIDLSAEAISFCKAIHKNLQVSFLEADAEALPFKDNAFDIVTNIESSHSYPNLTIFYSEVFRVLKPAGRFLYTDLLSAECLEETLSWLKSTGFLIERQRDITSNVMLSCQELAQSRALVFAGYDDPHMAEFLALPGSTAYEGMRTGMDIYMLFQLMKPEGVAYGTRHNS